MISQLNNREGLDKLMMVVTGKHTGISGGGIEVRECGLESGVSGQVERLHMDTWKGRVKQSTRQRIKKLRKFGAQNKLMYTEYFFCLKKKKRRS